MPEQLKQWQLMTGALSSADQRVSLDVTAALLRQFGPSRASAQCCELKQGLVRGNLEPRIPAAGLMRKMSLVSLISLIKARAENL